MVTDVKECRVDGFVLALKQLRRFGRDPTENARFRINDVPFSSDISW
jgi:hypothetical protein